MLADAGDQTGCEKLEREVSYCLAGKAVGNRSSRCCCGPRKFENAVKLLRLHY